MHREALTQLNLILIHLRVFITAEILPKVKEKDRIYQIKVFLCFMDYTI